MWGKSAESTEIAETAENTETELIPELLNSCTTEFYKDTATQRPAGEKLLGIRRKLRRRAVGGELVLKKNTTTTKVSLEKESCCPPRPQPKHGITFHIPTHLGR